MTFQGRGESAACVEKERHACITIGMEGAVAPVVFLASKRHMSSILS